MINNNTYTHSISSLVRWGELDMKSDGFLPGREEMKTVSAGELQVVPSQLIDPVEACKGVFQDIAIIETVSGDDLYSRVEAAFGRFDALVYFNQGLEIVLDRLADVFPFDRAAAEKFLAETSAALDALSVWFYEEVYPLRLTALNGLRKPRLDAVKPIYRFMFPWYAILADAPEELLIAFERFTPDIDRYIHTGEVSRQFKETFGDMALLYLIELNADRSLVAAIKENAAFGKSIMAFTRTHPETVAKGDALCDGIFMRGDLFKYDISKDFVAQFENSAIFQTTLSDRCQASRHAVLDELNSRQSALLLGKETLIAIPWLRQEEESRKETLFDRRYVEQQQDNPLFKRVCAIYDYAQAIEYSYFICFLDADANLIEKTSPKKLPLQGLPVDIHVPDGAVSVLAAIGYEDWIEQEWDMLENDKKGRPLRIYYILFTPVGSRDS